MCVSFCGKDGESKDMEYAVRQAQVFVFVVLEYPNGWHEVNWSVELHLLRIVSHRIA